MEKFGPLAESVYKAKYAQKFGDGTKEEWSDTCLRVSQAVCGGHDRDLADAVFALMLRRQFLPGGRYLYCSGRKYQQLNNCALLKAYDSRKGWANLAQRTANMLMTGMGVGVVYSPVREKNSPVGGMGGLASGPCALMQIINEQGRHIQQGGSRRSALWAGLHWSHPDVFDFIHLKDWPEWMKKAKEVDFNAAATMDGTNISVILDDAFFHAWHNARHRLHAHARNVFSKVVRQMLVTGEPGFSIDVGKNAGEHLRNAPVHGSTYVMTSEGYKTVYSIVGRPVVVWTGKQWASTTFTRARTNDALVEVQLTGRKSVLCSKDHPFVLADGSKVEAQHLLPGQEISVSLGEAPDGVYHGSAYLLGALYGDGSFVKGNRAELPLCGKKEVMHARLQRQEVEPRSASRDGRGILRLYYSRHDVLFAGRSKAEFPEEVYGWNREARLDFLAGLLDTDGNDHGGLCRLSSTNYEFLVGVVRVAESLGFTGTINKGSPGGYKGTPTWVAVLRGKVSELPCERLKGLKDGPLTKFKVVAIVEAGVDDVYCCDVGVEEHSFQAEGVIVSNCTEVTSRDDNDICNLASLNLARFDSLDAFRKAVYVGTGFLLHGTIVSDLPTKALLRVREKNRRLGLGLMGMHEWLVKRGKKYGPDEELRKWLEVYRDESDRAAKDFADRRGVSRPVARRAIAPTGTIAIVAETTSGIEPIFAVAFKRRFLKGDTWHAQYVVDSAAERMIQEGARPDQIEDAYTLAADPARRLGFQAFVQEYVDMGISSTLNLPAWGSALNNPGRVADFETVLFDHLPLLRGVTAYPDGSRGGQPLVPVPYSEAVEMKGVEFQEHGNSHACRDGVCGA